MESDKQLFLKKGSLLSYVAYLFIFIPEYWKMFRNSKFRLLENFP